jgi:protein-L-isoaspartate(D-aspartate) O-methyltransferase
MIELAGMPQPPDSSGSMALPQASRSDDSAFAGKREAMVAEQIVARGVRDAKVLSAMREVPRHLFVPAGLVNEAYHDCPVPIGHGQTISQPFIVAFMSEALKLVGGETVLEVGAGCGYQSAVLSRIAARVFGIEIVEALAADTRPRLARLGYENVEIRSGDGYLGWAEHAPFDAIMLNAAAPHVPEPLVAQLKEGGRMILPVGDYAQELVMVTRRGATYERRTVLDVRFVPKTGAIRGPA